jgi:predicted ATPase
MTLHLRSVELRAERAGDGFPFTVPAIRTLPDLRLNAPVTFFVGGNGSGKSTLLEAIAAAARLPAVGAEDTDRDRTLEQQRRLARALKLVWTRRTAHGFFLRAEDFFGFAKRLARTREEMLARLAEVEIEFGDASGFARGLAAGPARASIGEMTRLYGADLDARSHGEAFLKLFESRLRHGGLYLLDEPEAALSPQSQLALIALMADAVAHEAQFIIATHSPILLAYPGAVLLSFDSIPIERVAYDQLEHVALTREFLNDPVRYLRHIVPESDAAAG